MEQLIGQVIPYNSFIDWLVNTASYEHHKHWLITQSHNDLRQDKLLKISLKGEQKETVDSKC